MAEKTQYLKPDTVLKNYWSGNEQFADLFNAVLFDGKQVIQPDELTEMDTDASTVTEHRNHAKSIQASRDSIKIRKRFADSAELVLLGLENQEHIHYAMPMRVMGYDYSTYKKQYDSNAKTYKKATGLTEDEFLSRMKKTDRLLPVITLVIYYGEKPWDGARTLHEMLHIPKEMKPFVNDYRMHLVEARENSLTFHDDNNRDLFELLKILLDTSLPLEKAKAEAIAYEQEHHIDKSVIMTVSGATNNKIDYRAFEKGAGDMCTLFKTIKEEGREEGRELGISEGRELGISEGREQGISEGRVRGIIETGQELNLDQKQILELLQKKLNISEQEAEKYLKECEAL